MKKNLKSRLPKLKVQLEVLSLALTVLEKIRTLVAPLLMLLFRKVKQKTLFTVIVAVMKFSLLFFEQ